MAICSVFAEIWYVFTVMHKNRLSCEALSDMSVLEGHFTAHCNFIVRTRLTHSRDCTGNMYNLTLCRVRVSTIAVETQFYVCC